MIRLSWILRWRSSSTSSRYSSGSVYFHLLEAIVVHGGGVDVTAGELGAERLAEHQAALRRRGWSGPSCRRERRCCGTWCLRTCSNGTLMAARQGLARGSFGLPRARVPKRFGPRRWRDLEDEHEEPRLIMALTGEATTSGSTYTWYQIVSPRRLPRSRDEAVPDRDRERHEAALRERHSRAAAQGPHEDDRPLALVVLRRPRSPRRCRRVTAGAALPVELERGRARQVEEPQVHRFLRVAEQEVRLARTRRQLDRKLQRDRVGELADGAAAAAPASSPQRSSPPAAGWAASSSPHGSSPPPPGAGGGVRGGSTSSSSGTGSAGPLVPVFCALMSFQRTRNATFSES